MPNSRTAQVRAKLHGKKKLISYRYLFKKFKTKSYIKQPAWWIKYEIGHFKFIEGVDYFIIPENGDRKNDKWGTHYYFTIDAAIDIILHKYSSKNKAVCLSLFYSVVGLKKGGIS